MAKWSSTRRTLREIVDADCNSMEEFVDWLDGPIAFVNANLKHDPRADGGAPRDFLREAIQFATQLCPDCVVQSLVAQLSNPFASPRAIVSTLDAARKSCLAELRRGTDVPTDDRDKWIYDECCKGTRYESIIRRLRRKPKKWERIESPQGIRSAALRYADRHALPPPSRRQPGRPRRSKN